MAVGDYHDLGVQACSLLDKAVREQHLSNQRHMKAKGVDTVQPSTQCIVNIQLSSVVLSCVTPHTKRKLNK